MLGMFMISNNFSTDVRFYTITDFFALKPISDSVAFTIEFIANLNQEHNIA
jgi:hypothetical protein